MPTKKSLNTKIAVTAVAEVEKPVEPVLTPKEIAQFKTLLLRLREATMGNVSFLRKDSMGPSSSKEEDPDSYDPEFAFNLVGNDQGLVAEIDAALKRIELGGYGVCEMTGKVINRERLKAIPYTRHSIEAQQELEGARSRRKRIVI